MHFKNGQFVPDSRDLERGTKIECIIIIMKLADDFSDSFHPE